MGVDSEACVNSMGCETSGVEESTGRNFAKASGSWEGVIDFPYDFGVATYSRVRASNTWASRWVNSIRHDGRLGP